MNVYKALAVLSLMGMLVVTGCGGKSQSQSGSGNPSGSPSVAITAGSAATSADGLGVELYPGATTDSSNKMSIQGANGKMMDQYVVALKTADDVDKVAAFYKAKLTGYYVDSTSEGNRSVMLSNQKQPVPGMGGIEETTVVNIQRDKDATDTTITLVTYREEK